jgi:hypothetical protein
MRAFLDASQHLGSLATLAAMRRYVRCLFSMSDGAIFPLRTRMTSTPPKRCLPYVMIFMHIF